MSAETIKTEEFWNPEHIVEKFWNGLEGWRNLCTENAKNVEQLNFLLILACNTCGYHETEWTTLSRKRTN